MSRPCCCGWAGQSECDDHDGPCYPWSPSRQREAFWKLCHEAVVRKGEEQPCDKPSVALRIDPEEGQPYPVCCRHTRGQMVLLNDVPRELLR